MSSYGKLEPQDREERRAGCVDLGPRNRRSEMRVTDIHRIVDKRCGPVPPANPELEDMLKKVSNAGNQETIPLGWDKNSPSALKQLRWAIYEMIDSYSGDICKLLRITLQQRVEELFKEYTES